tara:strand:- start:81721 stop:82296 length:576 start_codon:yes stop_codon:yes gene_type:complete
MKSSKDQIYIDKVLSGDASSYRHLVEAYKDMAYTVALKIVRNSEDAEEVAQDSFIKAFQQLKTFQGKSKFSTWLYTIVYRTAISKTRKKKVTTTSIDEYVIDNYSTDISPALIEGLKHEEQQKYIKAAINQLPELDALLVTLFYVNENTLEEIEKITGYSKTNIKVRLFRARKKLYKVLECFLDKELKTIL